MDCVLCFQCEETKITGALSTKDEVTAHQNCLLFSSGLYCRNSPQFDDLFGFSVEDVLDEVKRGSKLICFKCKRKGATAGCEIKRCKKSYHYPCAVQDGAHNVEDTDQGEYGLYCFQHYQQTQSSVNGGPSSSTKSQTSKRASEGRSSKVYCLACKKKKGNISLDSLSSSIVMLYCHKHAPASQQKNTDGDSTTSRRWSVCSTDSEPGSRGTPSSSKRKRNLKDKQEETAPKRKAGIVSDETDDSSNPDESEPEPVMALIVPVDTDFDKSATSVPEAQLIRRDSERPSGSTSENQVADGSVHGNDDKDETIIHSDSESLLPPVPQSPSAATAVVSTRTASPLSPRVVLYKPKVAAAPRLDREPSFFSTSFWKSCNAAGCTQALFTGFVNDMNAISSRIQSDQASQADYDHALTVMTVSGKLTELVAQQQEELQRKQTELLKATAAMKEVVSALQKL